MAKKRMQMDQKSWEIEEIFPRFVNAQMAKGVSDKTVLTYNRHFRSLGYHLDMTMTFDDLTKEALDASIKMAKEMLLNNYDLGTDYLEEAIKSGQLSPDLVEFWPIFIQYRKTNQYKLFRERHATQIEDQSVRRDDLSIGESDTNDECIQDIKDNIIQEIK